MIMKCPECGREQLSAPRCRFCGTEMVAPKTRIQTMVTEWYRQNRHWRNLLVEAVVKALVGWAVTWIVFSAGLFLVKILWSLYSATLVGSYYVRSHPVMAADMARIMAEPPWLLSLAIVILALVVVLAFSALARVLHLLELLYYGRGLFFRLAAWGGLVSAVAAPIVQQSFGLELFASAFFLGLFAAVCVLPGCMDLILLTVPEGARTARMLAAAGRQMSPHLQRLLDGIKSFLSG